MGLGNNDGRFAYVNIKQGKLAIKKGNEIVLFNYIEGFISDIDIRTDEYQGKQYKKLCISIDDGSESFQLQMKLDSGYGRAFCNMIENVNLEEPVKITPTYEEKDGKGYTGMFMNQNKQPIKWKYTKDHPHDLPPLEKVSFKGQEMWDNSKQMQFYYELLMTKIKPKLNAHASVVAGPAHQFQEKERIPTAAEITEPIDDLPF